MKEQKKRKRVMRKTLLDRRVLESIPIEKYHIERATTILSARKPSKSQVDKKLHLLYGNIKYTSKERKVAITAIKETYNNPLSIQNEAKKIAQQQTSFDALGCVYIGRPILMGGNYRVDQLRQGSPFANPYTVSSHPVPGMSYTLTDSLNLFETYVLNRCYARSLDELYRNVAIWPTPVKLFIESILAGKNKYKKYIFLRLSVVGHEFLDMLYDTIYNQDICCHCDLGSNNCHGDILLKIMNILFRAKEVK